MTYEQIDDMIGSVGLPYAYDHFDKDDVNRPAGPPFIAFLYPQNNDPVFDDRNYVQIEQLVIELYTDNKDFDHETAIEDVLNANDLPFYKGSTYLDDERMYMTTYTMEVLINGSRNE